MKPKKQIVFYYATSPSVMIYKIAKMFKKRGYETVLLTMCEKDRFDNKFYSEAFDKIIYSNFQFFKLSFKTFFYILRKGPSFIKFLISMKLLNPFVVIGISGNNWQLKLAHKYFFKKYPFIYFPYDILSHYVNPLNFPPNFEIEAEKYCFENLDGVIHKGDSKELKFIEGQLHDKINMQKFQLSFFPYCSKEFIVPVNKNKLSKKDKELHIVYVGYLFNDEKSIQKFTFCFNEIMKQKIHIHIYTEVTHIPKKKEKEYIKEFFKSFKNNKYFHSHSPLNPKEIISEISKYDFGFWPIQECPDIEVKFSTGNKLSSYLEAGIPLIYGEKLNFINKLTKKYHLNHSFNEKNITTLNKRIKKLNYLSLVENVKRMRKDFDMDKNFPRLENFINKVIKKKQQSF